MGMIFRTIAPSIDVTVMDAVLMANSRGHCFAKYKPTTYTRENTFALFNLIVTMAQKLRINRQT